RWLCAGETIGLQLRSGAEQFAQRAGFAVDKEKIDGTLRSENTDRPEPVVLAAAEASEGVIGRVLADHVDRPPGALIERNPFLPQMLGADRQNLESSCVPDRLAYIRPRMLGQHRLGVGRHVDADQRRSVAVGARADEQTLACSVEKYEVRAGRIVERDEAPGLRLAGLHSVDLLPALGRLVSSGEPDLPAPVEKQPAESRSVFVDELAFAAGQIDRPDVVPTRVAI